MFTTSFSGCGPAVVQDDRSDEQHATHAVIVWGRDKFLSGWGGAKGGHSWAGWAARREDVHAAEAWVRGRSDMQYVRVGGGRPRGRSVAHVHVYVYDGQVAR